MQSYVEHNSQSLEVGFPGFGSLSLADEDEALRALQNPALFTSKHYKQAAIAVGVGIAIRLAIAIPVCSALCI